jgi:hypothetical protein
MDDMKIEEQIFYFKEGVVGDVENERSIAIRIIDALQSENKKLRETLDFYANAENYCRDISKVNDEWFYDIAPIIDDGGFRARNIGG